MEKKTVYLFGDVLRNFRKRRRLSQQALAVLLGVHRNTISIWERGDFLPESKTMVLELADRLGLNEPETRQLLEASLTALATYWSVPFLRNPFFTGRETILNELYALFTTKQRVALAQMHALHGLGGIGKTQVALEYAYRHALEYSALFWIEAETMEQILTSFLRIADVLQLPERKETDQQRVVGAVQRWLATHGQWLLIWDNLEDLDLLQRFLPLAHQGAVLLTTRRQALGTLAHSIELSPMTLEEGIVFVLRRAKFLREDPIRERLSHVGESLPHGWKEASELVRVMGGVPLALDQAGAYIEETQCSLEDYLHRYQQHQARFLARRGGSSQNHPATVVTTLSLSFQQVVHKSTVAADLLRICAYLAPDSIPEEVMVQGAAHLGASFQAIAVDPWLLDEAMAVLGTYSLVRRNQATKTLSIHRLVQAVLLDAMTEEERDGWLQRVIAALNAVFPASEYRTWEQCERLLSHVLGCLAQADSKFESLELGQLASKAAMYLGDHSRSAEAEPLFQRAIRIWEQAGELEDPQLAYPLTGLGFLYLEQGKYVEAELLFRRSIRLWEQACELEYSQNSPLLDMTASLNGLAILFRNQAKYTEAEALLQRVLRIREQTLGLEHSEVASTLGSLALLSHWQGRYREAEHLYQRSLLIWEHILGLDNPGAAGVLTGLGFLYYAQGRNGEMEPLLQRAIHIWEHTLGPEHSQVLYPLIGLARLSSIHGHYAEAEQQYQRAIRIREHALEPDDPRVGYLLEDLAGFRHAQGNYAEAKELYHQALSFWERTLGSEHPQIAHTLNGCANLFRDQGDYAEAEVLYRRSWSIREQVLGSSHPEVAETMLDFARCQQAQGNVQEAISLYQRALVIREQVLGPEHPQMTSLLNSLAALYGEIGRDEVAESLLENVSQSCFLSKIEQPSHC